MQTPTRTDSENRRGRVILAAAVALVALLAAALAAHAYVGLFARYMADDYCTAGTVRTAGLLGTQRHFYLAWSGRFSFTLTVSLLELLGTGIVPYLPLAALVCWVAATTWAAYELLSHTLGRRPVLFSVLVAELIVYATVADNTGGVFEALYWQTGMLTYVAPLVLLTTLAGFYARAVRRADVSAPGAASLAAFFASACYVGGFSETSAFMQIGAFAVACAATHFLADAGRRRRLFATLVAGLSGSVAALATVALAPGNNAREATLPAHSDLFTVIARALSNALTHAFTEHNYGVTFAPRWAALLLACVLSFYLSLRSDKSVGTPKRLRRMFWLAGSGLFVYFCCFFPASYAISAAPPPRALVVAQFVLVCTLVSLGWVAGEAAGAYFNFKRLKPQRALVASLAALVVLLSFGFAASARRTFALAGRARPLARLWDAHDAEIRARINSGEKSLTVPVAYNVGGTDVMTSDPDWYVNKCMAVYYGAYSITGVPDKEGLMSVVGDVDR
ncbi:MAG TPA: DUF6056 family protein [Pyrinomonadaceae bacterium]|nr:DUF6056 family protein [Pyrinomonadaceae bacterium]